MNLLTKDELRASKHGNTVAIMGSGTSVNDLSSAQWDALGQLDTIGFNWFFKSHWPCRYYLVREQCASEMRSSCTDESLSVFHGLMETQADAIKVIVAMADKDATYHHDRHTETFAGSGVVVGDNKHIGCESYRSDPFAVGLSHRHSSMDGVLHLAVWMGYENVLFVGVDLYDSRYFWTPNLPRQIQTKKGIAVTDPHRTARNTIESVKALKNYGIKPIVANKHSLLAQCCEVWS